MPGGFDADDALWAALAQCEDRDEMSRVFQAWIEANEDYWAPACPSPGGWTPPAGCRPAWDWTPPSGLRARPNRVPIWVRVGYHTPFVDRLAYEWMWHHGGFDVLPPGPSREAPGR